jgi:hypothetical protein
LSVGPAYHIGSFYYTNSDFSTGTQQFSNTYLDYMPLDYYHPYSVGYNYTLGYYNPYFHNPRYELDLVVAEHAYQKFLTKHLAGTTGAIRAR